MSELQPATPARRHTLSVLLAVFNGLVLLGAGSLAALAFSSGGGSYGWLLAVVALVQVPALVSSIARLRGSPLPALRPGCFGLGGATLALVIAWPLLLLIGSGGIPGNTATLGQVFGGFVQVLAVAIPVVWLQALGRRGLRGGSLQRNWGVVSVSTAFTVPLILLIEGVALFSVILMAGVALFSQPEMARRLQELTTSLRLGGGDVQDLIRLVEPQLNQQGLIFGVLIAIAGLAPLVEEMFKPLAAWFLVRRNITPAQGFSAGLIAGACFALMESLTYVSNLTVESGRWAFISIAVVRCGTALIHIACSGLVGWGLAEAWRGGRYLRLGGQFLLAVFIHGTWNGLSLLQGLDLSFSRSQLGALGGLSGFSLPGMVLLLVLCLCVLVFGNRSLRSRQEVDESIPPPPPAVDNPGFDPYAPLPPSV